MTKTTMMATPVCQAPDSQRHTHLMMAITYHPQRTDPESLASGFNHLLTTIWDLAGADFQDDYGPVQVGEFLVLADPTNPTLPPPITLAIQGGDESAQQEPEDLFLLGQTFEAGSHVSQSGHLGLAPA